MVREVKLNVNDVTPALVPLPATPPLHPLPPPLPVYDTYAEACISLTCPTPAFPLPTPTPFTTPPHLTPVQNPRWQHHYATHPTVVGKHHPREGGHCEEGGNRQTAQQVQHQESLATGETALTPSGVGEVSSSTYVCTYIHTYVCMYVCRLLRSEWILDA